MNVTVTKTGNGLVRINDQETETSTVEKGGDVKLELIPAKGAYIQELTVKGEPRTVKKGETFQETLTADEDITVSVTFAQEYTVTVTADKGGKVLLDGEAVTEKTYKEGLRSSCLLWRTMTIRSNPSPSTVRRRILQILPALQRS